MLKGYYNFINESVTPKKQFKVGDVIQIKDTEQSRKQGKLPDHAYEFLKSATKFEVLKTNDKGKMDLGCYNHITTEDGKKKKMVFAFSPNRFELYNHGINISNELKGILKFMNDKVANFILSLENAGENILANDVVDYLEIEDEGMISYIPRRIIKPMDNPYKSRNRQKTRPTRLLRRLVKPEFLDEKITQRDLEVFSNKWTAASDNKMTVTVLRGENIMDAYNYTGLLSGKFSSSCANFIKGDLKNTGYGNPQRSWYDVYVENPENIYAIVVYKQGKILGRRLVIEGMQTETHGYFKEGTIYKFALYYYGEGGRGSVVDQKLVEWCRDNSACYVSNAGDSKPDGSKLSPNDIFRVKIKDTKFKRYPSFDKMVVNFKTDEIASRVPQGSGVGWVGTYGAMCRDKDAK